RVCKLRKVILATVLSFSIVGCMPSTMVPDLKTVVQSTSPSTITSVMPSVSQTVTATPSTIVEPTPVTSSSAITTPIVTTSPTIKEEIKTPLNIGINKVYDNISSGLSTLPDNEIQRIEEDLTLLNPSFIAIELNQKIVDSNYQGKDYFTWKYYDKMMDYLRKKNVDVFFTIKFDKIINNKSTPTDTHQEEFIIEAIKRYSFEENKVSWIIGEKINDIGSSIGTQRDYINYLDRISKLIKKNDSSAKVYAGTISQGEVFGKDYIETNENLLSYLNMGIQNFVDGFVFENYFLSVNTYYLADNTLQFSGLNYKSLNSYYTSIKELLLKNGIKDKELILKTGTFGGETIEKVRQEEVEQGNENFKAFVYSKVLGFDKVMIDRFYDVDSNNAQEFLSRTGLIKVYGDSYTKKDSYWSFKFLTDKLNGAMFKEAITGLPSNLEGYIFKKDNKNYYIVWNNNKDFKDNISISIKEKSGTAYYSANQISTLGSSIEFQTPASGKYTINFALDNLSPKILETVD
ncbi:MAG: hypothetical protein ACK4IX_02160, partial [Candidatus Sericytochromatia bacterium]